MQPSVANASDRCNDATQRCKHISQLQFPADILPTFDFPPPKTSLLEGGGPPQRWKEFEPVAFTPNIFFLPTHTGHMKHMKHMKCKSRFFGKTVAHIL